MFSTATAFRQSQQLAAAYRQVGAETAVYSGASPHQLVQMLFDGYLEAINQAKGHLRAGKTEQKGRAITRAVRIVDEGLRASLNLKDGGSLAQDLHDLYGYVTMRLTLANLRNDENGLEECARLMRPLRDAWKSIGPQVDR